MFGESEAELFFKLLELTVLYHPSLLRLDAPKSIALLLATFLITACGGGGGASSGSSPYSSAEGETNFDARAQPGHQVNVQNPGGFAGEFLHEPHVDASNLYIPTGINGGGIAVVDISKPESPVVSNPLLVTAEGNGNLAQQPRDIALTDTVLFAVNGNTLSAIRKVDGVTLDEVTINQDYDATSIAIAGDVAYVTGGGLSGADLPLLRSFNIADPTNIVLLDELPVSFNGTAFGGRDVIVAGQKAYVAAYADGACIVDVSDPSALMLDACFQKPPALQQADEKVTKLLLQDDTLFMLYAGGDYSLTAVDVSDPVMPAYVASVVIDYAMPEAYDYLGMALADEVLFLGTLDRVSVLNAAPNSANFLDQLGELGPSGVITGLTWHAGYLYVATPDALEIHDISANP